MKGTAKRSSRDSVKVSPVASTTQSGPSSETARHLFECALTLFAEKGYEATSVREIINAAGVTQPTLYYYCESKQDLFLKLVRRTYEQSLQQLQKVIEQTTGCESRLRAIAIASFSGCAADIRVPKLMFQTAFGPPIAGITETMRELAGKRFSTVLEVIQSGIKSGELEAESADGLTLAFCCLLDQHVNILIREPNWQKLLTPKHANWLVSLFLNGATNS